MKTSLILLVSLCPFLALAAPLQDAEKVAQEVQEEVEDSIRYIAMAGSMTIENVPKDIKKLVDETQGDLRSFEDAVMVDFEEVKKIVKAAYENVKGRMDYQLSLSESTMKIGQSQLDHQFKAWIDQATSEKYGELSPKVLKALEDAHRDIQAMLSQIVLDSLAEAHKQMNDHLSLAGQEYGAALLKYPGQDKFGEAVQLLTQGLDKAMEVVKNNMDHVIEVWSRTQTSKIEDDIKRTITGSK